MAREQQRGGRQTRGSAQRVSLDEALEATQQQSVPVLPAPDETSPRAAMPPSARGRAIAPSGPARRTLAAATGIHPTLPPPTHATGSRRSHGPRPPAPPVQDVTETATRRQDAAPPEPTPPQNGAPSGRHEAPPLHAANGSKADVMIPGRPTLSLPTITGADLQAVTADTGDHGLARRETAQPQPIFIRGSRKVRHPAATVVPRRIGPRSFVAQFVIAMVTVMTLFSVLTLASPLGRITVFASTFQASANSIPWIPTPTPTPKPKPKPYSPPQGVNPGQQAIINDIAAIFGPYAQGAENVARCESDFDPNARNPYPIGNSHAEGVFQILYPSTWDTTSYAGYSPYNYDANIRAAYQIFSRDGHTWREWACQP